jgi:hypothetical protein
MPWMGFETTIPVFERAKTVHSLNGSATVIGLWEGLGAWSSGGRLFWKRFSQGCLVHSGKFRDPGRLPKCRLPAFRYASLPGPPSQIGLLFALSWRSWFSRCCLHTLIHVLSVVMKLCSVPLLWPSARSVRISVEPWAILIKEGERVNLKTSYALPPALILYMWLGHYTTSWKVAGSIPDEVILFFN